MCRRGRPQADSTPPLAADISVATGAPARATAVTLPHAADPPARRTRGWAMGRVKSALTVAQVLAWADEHHARTGRWPRTTEVVFPSLPPGETWPRIDLALRQGHRGLPGG